MSMTAWRGGPSRVGIVNAAIADALSGEASKVIADNLAISFSGAVDLESLKRAIGSKLSGRNSDRIRLIDSLNFAARHTIPPCRCIRLLSWSMIDGQRRDHVR